MKIVLTAAALIALTAPAFSENNVAQGEKDFTKCSACHSITAADGEKIVEGGVSGPNLWGVVGRVAGTDTAFGGYSPEMVALGRAGLSWTPDELAAYVPDAKSFLRERSGDSTAKTAMTPQKLDDVSDVIAYLAQFAAK